MRAIALIILTFLLTYSPSSWAFSAGDTFDLTKSLINFNKLIESASGLLGDYEGYSKRNERVNIKNVKDALLVEKVKFHSSINNSALGPQGLEDVLAQEADDNTAPRVTGALVYPNPFRQSSNLGAQLGYELSKNMDLEIHVYNMLSQRILKRTFNAGAIGARKGYNKLVLNAETFQQGTQTHFLSAGIYFYIFIHEGQVLARGKMAVKP